VHTLHTSSRAHGAERKSTDLKNWPKDAFGGLREPFFSPFFRFSTQRRRHQFISTRGYAHTPHTFIDPTGTKIDGLQRIGPGCLLAAQKRVLSPILRISPGQSRSPYSDARRAHAAHAHLQNTRREEPAEDAFVRAQDASRISVILSVRADGRAFCGHVHTMHRSLARQIVRQNSAI
jgi:hypothetical protein